MKVEQRRAGLRGQLSLAGVLIGCVGCVIITASSVYTALKLGALPWPTIFTSITSLVLLRAVGRTSLNEANITQVIMSAGSMVAGGVAFTIPGIWILGMTDVTWLEMLAVTLAGTLLGLVCTALIRKHFVDESDLEYPIGTAAAETLIASTAGGSIRAKLFGSMALAGLWTVLRDVLGFIPTLLLQLPIPGVSFGIHASPMRLSVGFLVGARSIAWWTAGAIVAAFGITVAGSHLGLWSLTSAEGIVSSLGMGLMMGSGIGVVIKDIVLPLLCKVSPRSAHTTSEPTDAPQATPSSTSSPAASPSATASSSAVASSPAASSSSATASPSDLSAQNAWTIFSRFDAGMLALMVAIAALVACFALELGPVVSLVIVLFSFVTAIMSAQSVGQSGIDPMEIFGLIVLLFVATFANVSQIQLFFTAGIIAVACGLAGDVMSDFKTGQIIGTNPRTLWLAQVIGALMGTVVSVAVLIVLVGAYGTQNFGGDGAFVAAQAEVVATMVAGIPSIEAFVVGFVAGAVMYCMGLPAMMFGLGIYLPFYMSITATFGAIIRKVYDYVCKRSKRNPQESEEAGIVVASGLLGGESIIGVLVALASVIAGLM